MAPAGTGGPHTVDLMNRYFLFLFFLDMKRMTRDIFTDDFYHPWDDDNFSIFIYEIKTDSRLAIDRKLLEYSCRRINGRAGHKPRWPG